MNITFLTTRLFDEPRSGGEICSARALQELTRAGHRVRVIGRGALPPPAGSGLVTHASVGASVPAFDDLPRRRRFGALLAALATGQASTVRRLVAGGAAQHAGSLLGEAPPLEALWVDHLQVWPWIAARLPLLPAPVVLMHNLESEGYAQRARRTPSRLQRAVLQREARLLQELEIRVLRQAAVVACLSEQDAAHLRCMAAACRSRAAIEVLAGFPLCAPAPARPAVMVPGQRRIGLLGTWTWGPNRSGLQWMLEQVLPRLPDDCRLVLAGAGLETQRLPPRVESLGRIADAHAFYERVDVIAIPSLHGSGVQEKAIEAIARGLPVVATPHALRGLGPGLPGHVRAAAEPAPFARLCAEAAPCAGAAEAAGRWADERRWRYRKALDRCLRIAAALSTVPTPASAARAAP